MAEDNASVFGMTFLFTVAIILAAPKVLFFTQAQDCYAQGVLDIGFYTAMAQTLAPVCSAYLTWVPTKRKRSVGSNGYTLWYNFFTFATVCFGVLRIALYPVNASLSSAFGVLAS